MFVASASIIAIKSILTEIGFKEIYDCFTLFKEVELDGLNYKWSNDQMSRSVTTHLKFVLRAYDMLPNDVIQTLNVGLTTRCTLRCRDCSQYIPLIKNPKDYGCDKTIESIKILTSHFGYDIIELRISLAEALIYKDLHIFLQKLRSIKNIETIQVLTNGTVLPSTEVIDALVADRRILVRWSNYGETSSKAHELVEILNRFYIRYEVTNHIFWVKHQEMTYQSLSKHELQDKFLNCFCRVPTLIEGKLYYCFCEFLGEVLDVFDEKLSTAIDLLTPPNTIGEMLTRKTPIPACSYCYKVFREKLGNVPVAKQIT